LLLGGLLSATDPVAVVALLRELGASKKLSTLIEGESLMNDGTAIVVFQLFLQMVLGQKFDAGDVIEFLCRVALGALALGLAFGIVSVFWVGLVFNDTVIEITLTLTASYLAFFVAEDEAGVSGVLTVMTVGLFFAAFARTAFTGESEQSMHYFWEMISYIANTLIFLLSGVVIAESILRSQDQIQGRDWGYLAILYVFVQLSRVVVVGLLYPGLKYFGYGLNWKEAVVLVWAGLRGAVALSLSLSVAVSTHANSKRSC
jgi:NhaP-type Na+/H+ or K+/H+ antiporter